MTLWRDECHSESTRCAVRGVSLDCADPAELAEFYLTAGERLYEPAQRAVALGARPTDSQPDPRWKVLLDPAGHPVLHHHLGAAARVFRDLNEAAKPRPGGRDRCAPALGPTSCPGNLDQRGRDPLIPTVKV